ncbi:hypothetical protein [Ruminococcus flavefaciens]|uniref:Uncharacterized protein n=1 Tax=Ruminococcus flavefaciens TaxID=1265 RepID=A0A315XWJ0_RUMFL|nr:hypothetical protein [Ruminococcus flavefaciens]PWJ09867.1 hypothetical protein IE37_03301 [Ruminococcus flavefaciens]SSA52158.1 hypothetical protein SAMN02910325_03301 [Ruminococcus flavefaciens]
MKKTFKKVLASAIAVTTMAVSAVGMSASADTGYTSFSPNASAILSVTSSFVSASTNCTIICSTITASITATTGGTLTGDTLKSAYNTTSVYVTANGSVDTATSYHYVKNANGSGSTTMWAT